MYLSTNLLLRVHYGRGAIVIVIVGYSFLCKLTNEFSKQACNNTNLNKEVVNTHLPVSSKNKKSELERPD